MTRTAKQVRLEYQALVREREDEFRHPVSSRDRRQWFERTNKRIRELKAELAELTRETNDDP